MDKLLKHLLVCATLFVLAGCACLGSYNVQTQPSRHMLAQGDFEKAIHSFPVASAKGHNEVLVRLERGTILQAMGKYAQSEEEFQLATGRIKEFEDRAIISASKTTSKMGTLIINEQAKPYEGEDFEKVLIHALNAVNYVMQGDIEGARVEIRNAYSRQNELYNRHSKALERAEKDADSRDWQRMFEEADYTRYSALRTKAESVYSVYQNAFAYYISALVYELNREPDEAYIDLKKAIRAAPGSLSIQRDLLRLSRDLGFRDDFEKWENSFQKHEESYGEGIDIFIILGIGMAPYKIPITFPIPTGRGGIVFTALPVYEFTPSTTRSGIVVYNSKSIETSTVFDTDGVASRNLLDKFPILFAKQVLRTSLKAVATNRLAKEYGVLGALAGSVAAAVTEQADLRTWSSLPKQFQVGRAFVPEGTGKIILKTVPTGFSRSVDIPEGAKHVIVLGKVTNAGLSLQTRVF